MDLSERIAQYVSTPGRNMSRLSEASGISTSLLAKYEARRVRPSPANLERLAGPLGVSHAELMQEFGYISGLVRDDAPYVDPRLLRVTSNWDTLEDWQKAAIEALSVPSATHPRHTTRNQAKRNEAYNTGSLGSQPTAPYISQDGAVRQGSERFGRRRQAGQVAA